MRRGLRALGAVVLLTAALLVAPPAGAAPDREPTVGNLGPELVHLDAFGDDEENFRGRPAEELVFTTVFPRGVRVLRDVTVTVDFRSLRGLARVDERGDWCPREGRVVTCTFDRLGEGLPVGEYELRAREDARPGDEGALRFRATSPELPRAVTWETRVVVGEPLLEIGPIPSPRDLAPGDSFGVPIRIVNRGDVPADGIVLSVSTQGALAPLRVGGSACGYLPRRDVRFGSSGTCEFDTRLEPGDAVRMTVPLRVATAPTLLYGDLDVVASPAGTLALDVYDPREFRAAGGGPTARLVPARAPERSDGILHRRIRTTGSLDLAAFGDRARGRVGDTVDVTVGVRNLGPQVVDLFDRPPAYRFEFTPPPGTTVVGNPSLYEDREWECSPQEPGAASYECPAYSSELRLGARQRYRFELRIDDNLPGAGVIEVFPNDGAWDLRDPDRGNDTAPVLVRARGSAADVSPAAGEPAGDDGDAGFRWWWAGVAALVAAALLALRRLLSGRA